MSPFGNKKNKDFKEEHIQDKSSLQSSNKVGAKSDGEKLQRLGEGRGNNLFQAHVTVMTHDGNLGQHLQLGKHQEKITFIIKTCT